MARADNVLQYILRSEQKALEPAAPGKSKVRLDFSVTAQHAEDNRLVSVRVEYPKIPWCAICDRQGMTTEAADGVHLYAWTALDGPPCLPMDVLQSALYEHRNELLAFPLTSTGPWSSLTCPGWFGLTLYNALLKAEKGPL